MSLIGSYGSTQSNHSHEELMQRKEHCVCKRCGGTLETALIVYNKYGGSGEELYCANCQQKEYGIEKMVYDMAKYYVETFQFNYFYDMENGDINKEMNVAKVAEMMSWILKNLNLLDEQGLKENAPDYQYYLNRRKNRRKSF